ncbi:hypothetical protein GXW74_15155 [Roseomonas eburnea]|uniref:Uncharacterized protein n=1 Tax=Neoroseomonas eburnea TaxID=1346889 RepID=A0A9X9XDP5_9PROT|nr:hypothetical protein [Neoroseomonas eburnea]MBR0681831.1 hypothetical protein [Neoroseomonas eburnea]
MAPNLARQFAPIAALLVSVMPRAGVSSTTSSDHCVGGAGLVADMRGDHRKIAGDRVHVGIILSYDLTIARQRD